ncbi:hypothetical protein CEE39_03925 [bacterium (candidate division B38) B3_B38]|nr:MAG: hypothetical protein CEE39_03925 [bacterium (candidate division B38) B3_B38]
MFSCINWGNKELCKPPVKKLYEKCPKILEPLTLEKRSVEFLGFTSIEIIESDEICKKCEHRNTELKCSNCKSELELLSKVDPEFDEYICLNQKCPKFNISIPVRKHFQ